MRQKPISRILSRSDYARNAQKNAGDHLSSPAITDRIMRAPWLLHLVGVCQAPASLPAWCALTCSSRSAQPRFFRCSGRNIPALSPEARMTRLSKKRPVKKHRHKTVWLRRTKRGSRPLSGLRTISSLPITHRRKALRIGAVSYPA